jgi:hypothetical protein
MSTLVSDFSYISSNKEVDVDNDDSCDKHILNRSWVLWSHLPQNNDWTIRSYEKLCVFHTLEDVISVINIIPDLLITNCMLFLMKEGVSPLWEDPKNKDGGCFKFRVINKHVPQTWRQMVYSLIGETLSSNKKFLQNVTGITISPKKKFCILKVWTSTCECQNSDIIDIENPILNSNKALFEIYNNALNKEG